MNFVRSTCSAALVVLLSCATGCVTGTPVHVPAGDAVTGSLGSQEGPPGLLDFTYSIVPGGERGEWILMSPGADVLVDGVKIQAFSMHVFDDDGDGIRQHGESVSDVSASLANGSSFIRIAALRVPHDAADPWIHAWAETTSGIVERTWRFEPPR